MSQENIQNNTNQNSIYTINNNFNSNQNNQISPYQIPTVIETKKPNKTSLISLNDFIAGSLAGIVQVLVGQPFDMMKVRMQTKPKKYFGIFQTSKKILVEENLMAFYKGTLSPLIGISFSVAVQFSSNIFAKNFFMKKNERKNIQNLTLSQNMLSGFFAGFCNSFLISPIELIRIKLQTQGSVLRYNGTVDCATQIYKFDGLRGIYQGFCSSLLRECPAYAIYFGLYETLAMKHSARNSIRKENMPLKFTLLYGGISGIALWLFTFPFDVVKSRIQADNPAKRKYKNILSTFALIYKDSGVSGFFKGIAPCLMRAPLGNGLTFLTFELVSKQLKKRE